MPVSVQLRVGSAVAPPWVCLGKVAQPSPQLSIRIRLGRPKALRGTVLADDLAGPPLRQFKPVTQHVDGLASPRRAHQFPLASSLNAAFSTSASASSRFKVEFSFSSSLSRLVSSAFIPPY